jgi:hypothetical protein
MCVGWPNGHVMPQHSVKSVTPPFFGTKKSSLASVHRHGRDARTDCFRRRDVCIIGGGASGASAAVFARDRNLTVALFESDSLLGGHCDTVKVTPPAPGYPDWIELGVQIVPDTALANAALDGAGQGRWSVRQVYCCASCC